MSESKSSSKIVWCTRQAPEEVVAQITDAGYQLVCWTERRKPTEEESDALLKSAGGFINCQWGPLGPAFFEKYSHLKFVATYSVGYDHINIPAATQAKIPVYNTPDVLSKATADTAFMLMMITARKAIFHYNRITSDRWGTEFTDPLNFVGQDLQGKTLGIFGLGRIGIEMAKAAIGAFNMKVIYHNRGPRPELEAELNGATYVTFDELLAQSDVISLHANLTAENTKKFNKDAFAKMKKTSILINTARGKMVDEEDLKVALKEGVIWGAGLDVTDPEPMKYDNELLTMENVAVLPHIGSATIETRLAMWNLCGTNAVAGMSGKVDIPSCINPEAKQ